MAFENIVVEITDHVGLIRLDRPNQKNVLALGSAVTRLGLKRKQALRLAEARGGRRGPGNLWVKLLGEDTED